MSDLRPMGISLPAKASRTRRPAAARPTKRRANPERDFQIALLRWLKLALPHGSFVQCVKNEAQPRATDPGARMRFFAKRKAEGHNTGFPDLAIILPGGRTVWLELKAGRNDTSDAQDGLHTRMRSLHHAVGVAWTIEEAAAILRGAGVVLRASP